MSVRYQFDHCLVGVSHVLVGCCRCCCIGFAFDEINIRLQSSAARANTSPSPQWLTVCKSDLFIYIYIFYARGLLALHEKLPRRHLSWRQYFTQNQHVYYCNNCSIAAERTVLHFALQALYNIHAWGQENGRGDTATNPASLAIATYAQPDCTENMYKVPGKESKKSWI